MPGMIQFIYLILLVFVSGDHVAITMTSKHQQACKPHLSDFTADPCDVTADPCDVTAGSMSLTGDKGKQRVEITAPDTKNPTSSSKGACNGSNHSPEPVTSTGVPHNGSMSRSPEPKRSTGHSHNGSINPSPEPDRSTGRSSQDSITTNSVFSSSSEDHSADQEIPGKPRSCRKGTRNKRSEQNINGTSSKGNSSKKTSFKRSVTVSQVELPKQVSREGSKGHEQMNGNRQRMRAKSLTSSPLPQRHSLLTSPLLSRSNLTTSPELQTNGKVMYQRSPVPARKGATGSPVPQRKSSAKSPVFQRRNSAISPAPQRRSLTGSPLPQRSPRHSPLPQRSPRHSLNGHHYYDSSGGLSREDSPVPGQCTIFMPSNNPPALSPRENKLSKKRKELAHSFHNKQSCQHEHRECDPEYMTPLQKKDQTIRELREELRQTQKILITKVKLNASMKPSGMLDSPQKKRHERSSSDTDSLLNLHPRTCRIKSEPGLHDVGTQSLLGGMDTNDASTVTTTVNMSDAESATINSTLDASTVTNAMVTSDASIATSPMYASDMSISFTSTSDASIATSPTNTCDVSILTSPTYTYPASFSTDYSSEDSFTDINRSRICSAPTTTCDASILTSPTGTCDASFVTTPMGTCDASFVTTPMGTCDASFVTTPMGTCDASFVTTPMGTCDASFVTTPMGTCDASFVTTPMGTCDASFVTTPMDKCDASFATSFDTGDVPIAGETCETCSLPLTCDVGEQYQNGYSNKEEDVDASDEVKVQNSSTNTTRGHIADIAATSPESNNDMSMNTHSTVGGEIDIQHHNISTRDNLTEGKVSTSSDISKHTMNNQIADNVCPKKAGDSISDERIYSVSADSDNVHSSTRPDIDDHDHSETGLSSATLVDPTNSGAHKDINRLHLSLEDSGSQPPHPVSSEDNVTGEGSLQPAGGAQSVGNDREAGSQLPQTALLVDNVTGQSLQPSDSQSLNNSPGADSLQPVDSSQSVNIPGEDLPVVSATIKANISLLSTNASTSSTAIKAGKPGSSTYSVQETFNKHGPNEPAESEKPAHESGACDKIQMLQTSLEDLQTKYDALLKEHQGTVAERDRFCGTATALDVSTRLVSK